MRFIRTLILSLSSRLRNGSRISPAAYLKGHECFSFGRKCKVHSAASVDASRGAGVRLGHQVTLNRYAYVLGGAGGVRLGDRVEVNNYAIINGTGGVDIGDDTLIGPGARIISYEHRFVPGQTIRSQAAQAKRIRIGKDVWIGANAIILAGITLGDGAVIAAGAVVTKDVAPGTVVAGVPARLLKMRA